MAIATLHPQSPRPANSLPSFHGGVHVSDGMSQHDLGLVVCCGGKCRHSFLVKAPTEYDAVASVGLALTSGKARAALSLMVAQTADKEVLI